MQLPQLSDSLTIDTDVHLAKSISPRYDMIIGRDLMRELDIKLDFEHNMIEYQNLSISMTEINKLDALNDLQFITGIKEPLSTAEAVERVSKILDAKYAPVTPDQILNNSSHLSDDQKRTLKPILEKYVKLFDGTLGKWKGVQHKLELKDPNSPPFRCRPYPVPVKNKQTLMLEIIRITETLIGEMLLYGHLIAAKLLAVKVKYCDAVSQRQV
ncbi:unnamed protein product [Cylindrotheca closterium]|uniref:Uncharacterized protein n=1 Tax=Cylindrotheca closterium TaxID=2856 RepID=A0AAD2CKE7_9STRA|nr:unnamed protein product [Cylindrotheca closterium]